MRIRRSLSRLVLGLALASIGILAVTLYNPYRIDLLIGYILGFSLIFCGSGIAGYSCMAWLQSRKKAKVVDLLLSMIIEKQFATGKEISTAYNARMSDRWRMRIGGSDESSL